MLNLGNSLTIVQLGSVGKPLFPCSEQPAIMVYTEIHITEARHLGTASTDRLRMGIDL